jgi:hypothetical protein
MKPIDALEMEPDRAGYPEVKFEELDDDGGAASEEIELLMRCVGAARLSGA